MKAILRIAYPPLRKYRVLKYWGMGYEVEGQIVCLSDKASYFLPVA